MEKKNLLFNLDLEFLAKELAKSDYFEDIIFELHSTSSLSEQIVEELIHLQSTVTSRWRLLLTRISNDDEAVDQFIMSLRRKGLTRLAEQIDPDLLKSRSSSSDIVGLGERIQTLPYIHNSASMPSLSLLPNFQTVPDITQSFSDQLLQETEEPIRIIVTPSNFVYPEGVEVYKNVSLPRGLVFIANFETFANDEHPKRVGSDVDVGNLRELLFQIGYKVLEPKINLNRNEFTKALKEFRDDNDLYDVDSSIIVIMSHGYDNDRFYTSDNRTYKVNEVCEQFNNINCPALASKPKIFILQYCRGDIADPGVEIYPPLRNISNEMPGAVTDIDGSAQGFTINIERKPTVSDMLLIFSTLQGFVSHRNPSTGSWLIETICKVFMRYAYEEDIESMMKKVSREMKNLNSHRGRKQVCEIRNLGFDKHFYFNPVPFSDLSEGLNLQELSDALPMGATGFSNDVLLTPPHMRRRSIHLASRSSTPDSFSDLSHSNSAPQLRKRHWSGGASPAHNGEELSVRPKLGSSKQSLTSGEGIPNGSTCIGELNFCEEVKPPSGQDVVDNTEPMYEGTAADFRAWRRREPPTTLLLDEFKDTKSSPDISPSITRFKRTLSVPSHNEVMNSVNHISQYLQIHELDPYVEYLSPIKEQILKNKNKGKRRKGESRSQD